MGFVEATRIEELRVGAHSRGFAFNADLVDALRLLNVGVRIIIP